MSVAHVLPLATCMPHPFLGRSTFARKKIEQNGQRGVYPRILRSNGGIGITRPREAPPHVRQPASNSIMTRKQEVPVAHAEQHAHLFFSGTLLERTAPLRRWGNRKPPFRLYMLGVYAPVSLYLCGNRWWSLFPPT